MEENRSFYTETFHEFIRNNPGWLEANLQFDTEQHTSEFISVLTGQWGQYEIAGETEEQQKQFLLDTYNEHYPYYKQLLEAYNKEFDWAVDGIKRKVQLSGSSTVVASGKDTELHIDLPNKVVSPTDYENYPSSVDITKPGTTQTTTPNTTTTYTNSEEFIAKKREYMNQLRNVYAEFGTRFFDCFIGIFL